MQVVCTACSARYTIADDKIPVQGARVRCRKCQAVFNVERPADAPPAPAALPLIPPTPEASPSPFAETPAPPSRSAPDAPMFAPPSVPPAPPQAPPSTEFERFTPAFSGGAPAPAMPSSDAFTSDRAAFPSTQAPPPPPVFPSAPEPQAPATAPAFAQPGPATSSAPAASPANASPAGSNVGIPAGLSEAERLKHERARRLARVLASDIAIYNKEKRDRGQKDGNLVAVLGYEIKKSWEVYKERVTPELANSTPYFRDALNEMLAEGKKVF